MNSGEEQMNTARVSTGLEHIKKSQTELNTITKIKNTLDGITSTLDHTEEWISNLKDKLVEITQAEQKKKKEFLKNQDSLRDLWDNTKCTNIYTIQVPEGERDGRGGGSELRIYLKK